MHRLLLALLLLAVALAGCASLPGGTPHPRANRSDELGVRAMAQVLKNQLRHEEVMDQPVVVTTFVDLNNLEKSSVFGRLLAEQLLNEFHQAGFTVSEVRKGKDIFIRQEVGETILTRDAREALGRLNARAIVAGTYVATAREVLVNARLIDINTPLVLSSCSYSLKMTEELRTLLLGESPF